MKTYKTISIGDSVHSDWYGEGTVLGLNEFGNGTIKFGSYIVTFMEFETFYNDGWMLSV